MSRYATSRIITTNEEKRYQSTTIVPVLPFSNSDIYIITTSVERLDKLANVFYNDSSKWWAIAIVNGLGKGSIMVPSNSRIRIPSLTNIQQVISNTNNLR
jgi:hypothetical protein